MYPQRYGEQTRVVVHHDRYPVRRQSPGHSRARLVSKLFHIISGRRDLGIRTSSKAVIRRMVEDQCFPIELVAPDRP